METDETRHPVTAELYGVTMKLEDQVCSLELANRLKELGVKQKSLFYWDTFKNLNGEHELKYIIPRTHIAAGYSNFYTLDNYYDVSAFTVGELGEMFPAGVFPATSKDDTGWYMQVINPIQKWKEMYPCKNEADARAKMLIHLLENKLMEILK